MVSFWRIWTSGHGIIRKFTLIIITLYSMLLPLIRASHADRADLVSLLFNWFAVSSFYLAFYFLISSSISGGNDPFGGAGDEIFQVFNKVYIGLM
jgi:chitin synthase